MSIKKHIPNTITLLNLICGACAVVMALWGHYVSAFAFMISSALFDFCDGFAARLLDSYSDIGKELDSLADDISFGLAPAMMFFSWYWTAGHSISALSFVPFIIAALSAVRLAKFNLDSRQSVNFIGLSTPLCALLIGSMTAFGQICETFGASSAVVYLLSTDWFIPVVSIVLSLMLLSEIPMFSLKHKRFGFKTVDNAKFTTFIISIPVWIVLSFCLCPDAVPVISALILSVTLISIFYIVFNIFWRFHK